MPGLQATALSKFDADVVPGGANSDGSWEEKALQAASRDEGVMTQAHAERYRFL